MKLKIETTILKEMVSKAVKGASMNKLIPLTSMIVIELNSNVLTLHTTDKENYLYIIQNDVDGEDFYVTVQIEQFSKLISKMTSEYVTLELKDNSLEVKGNGKYNIEIPLDENGDMIQFPDPMNNYMDYPITVTTDLSTIKTILNTAKSSVATTLEVPQYTGYYIGDKILTTDTYKICGIDVKLFEDNEVLISPEMMDLLDVIDTEKIDVSIVDDKLIFITPNCVIYGTAMDGIEDYDVNAISKLLDETFNSVCKIDKAKILAVLDRISLFVGVYDNKAIRLNFTKDGIDISSKQTNGIETVDYVESENFNPFTCLIDIDMLTTQIKAYDNDVIELHYGNEQFVSLINGKVTQIIALLEDV